MNDISGCLRRPIVLSLSILAMAAAIVVASSMSLNLPGVSWAKYVLVGVLYSGLLSLYSVGLALTPRRAQRGLVLAGIALAIAFGAWVGVVYSAGPEFVQLMVGLLLPIKVGLLGLLSAGGLFSLYGWIKFFVEGGKRGHSAFHEK